MLHLLALLVVSPGVVSQPQDGDRVSLVTKTKMDEITDISISPRGDRFLTREMFTQSPRLWDKGTMRVLRVLEVAVTEFDLWLISEVEFTPSGDHVVYHSASEIRVWDSTFGRETAVHVSQSLFYDLSSAISRDGRYFAVGSETGTIEVFTLPDLQLTVTLEGHESFVIDLEFTPDGTRLVSASSDKTARIWNLKTDDSLVLHGHTAELRWMQVSADGKYVLTTGFDDRALLFETETGQLVRSVASEAFKAVFIGENSEQVLVVEDGAMTVYTFNGRVLGELNVRYNDSYRVVQSPSSTMVAVFDDEQLQIWNLTELKEVPVKIGLGEPTAGTFSPDGTEFWLAMADGSIRRYDTETGDFITETVVVTVPEINSFVSPSGRWIYFTTDVEGLSTNVHGFANDIEPKGWLVDAYNPSERRETGLIRLILGQQPEWSADETRMIWKTYGESAVILYDVIRGKVIKKYDDYCAGATMSPTGDTFVTWHFTGEVSVWDVRDGEKIAGYRVRGPGATGSVSFHPTESVIVNTRLMLDGQKVIVIDFRTGDITLSVDAVEHAGPDHRVLFSPDGTKLALVDDRRVQVWEYPSGKLILNQEIEYRRAVKTPSFSPDGSMINFGNAGWPTVVVIATGEVMQDRQWLGPNFSIVGWSPDGLLTTFTSLSKLVYVWDPRKAETLLKIRTAGKAQASQFSPDGKRLYITDETDGLTVWNLSRTDELSAERVGSFVYMNGGESWLAWEETGRFDASDPNAVDGAHFVLEWSEGLEVVDVSQLKGRYWDPGLLAKIMGVDPDPRRVVPQIDDLRIFPDIMLSTGGSLMDLQIELAERDEGGIGKLQMWINDKRVYTKPDPKGYFTVDLTRFKRFFLPPNRLPEGSGNIVSVTVMNGRGNLTSPPVSIDVGVPEDLQTPDQKLFGLFVGIGDYVGTAKDLDLPPNDATVLELAVRTVAENLLPGQVETTLLTAAPGQPDSATRADILAWFEETAKKATSSDIVIVFFSGHGVNNIAGREDYFFLTPEADPTNVDVLSVDTATISGKQLTELLTSIPATKQILILDTCHSGAVTQQLLALSRSVGGDYRRAWEAMRSATGTWLLAGSAADQKSYEASNVGHGLLTYALLEAIDQNPLPDKPLGNGEQLFVDVAAWLEYAQFRVLSLKNEVGINGIQQPQFTPANSGKSFPFGVMDEDELGFLDIQPPKPIVVVGEFDFDTEDPLQLETLVREAMFESQSVKTWPGRTEQQGIYRVAAQYEVNGTSVTVSVFVQRYDLVGNRKTLERFELSGQTTSLEYLAGQVRDEAVKRILQHAESEKKKAA